MKLNKLKIAGLVSIPVILIGFQNCSKLGTNGIAVNDKTLTTESVEVIPPADPAVDPAATEQPPQIEQPTAGDEQPPANEQPSSNDNTNENEMPASNENPDDPEMPAIENPETPEMPADNKEPDKNELPRDNKGPDKNEMPAKHDQPSSGDNIAAVTEDEVAEAVKSCEDPSSGAASENLKLKFNHENVDLNAADVQEIKGNHGMVVIRATKEDSKVGSVNINHSTLVLCNFSEIREIKGPHNRIIVVGGKILKAKIVQSELSLVNSSVEDLKETHSVVKTTYSLK